MTSLKPEYQPDSLPFRKYIVLDVISTPSFHADQEQADALYGIMSESSVNHFADTSLHTDTPDILRYSVKAPRNSIIASEYKSKNQSTLLLIPFFSSHISFPVKPGEVVWGMIDSEGKGYWLSRVHEFDHVEDANYTHSDRSKLPTIQKTEEVKESLKLEINHVPGFPNGTDFANRESDLFKGTEDIEDLKNVGIKTESFSYGGLDEYEVVVNESLVKTAIVYESVPRLSKRPGDLSFQGSNNTSITLGTERGYGKVVRPDATKTNVLPENDQASKESLSEGMGAIDIVVGRGRLHGGSEPFVNADPAETRPRVIKNTREKNETHKNLGLEKGKAPSGAAEKDVPEGDPDLVHDAARLYLSMKSNPDTNFGLEYPSLGEGVEVSASTGQATAALKSDQIRIVARKDENNNINGAVRIIKEGTADSDRAVIIMEPDGTIMIDGPRIIVGSGFQDAQGQNGQGTQVILGRDASESIVLGDTLLRKLVALETAFNNHFHNGGTGAVGPHYLAAGGSISQEFASPPAAAVEALQEAQAAEAAEDAGPPLPGGADAPAAQGQPAAPTASASGRTILSKIGKTK